MIVTTALMGLLLAGQPSAPTAHLAVRPDVDGSLFQVLDNKCPVTGKAVSPDKGVKVMVRGREYLVFNQAAAEELAANPDKYLDPDGTPKNAKKHDAPGRP